MGQKQVQSTNGALFGEIANISTIGGRLRAFVAWRGFSLRAFSEQTGIPYRTLQKYVANVAAPGAEHLARISNAGVEMNWLVTGEIASDYAKGLKVDFARPGVALFCADVNLFKEILGRAIDLAAAYVKRAESEQALDPRSFMNLIFIYAGLMIGTGARAAENCAIKTKLSASAREMIRRVALSGADDVPDEWLGSHFGIEAPQ